MLDGSQFAYERIEAPIESMISERVLRFGDRAPSVREICRSDRVSPATAVRALTNLEAMSLPFAKVRSGF